MKLAITGSSGFAGSHLTKYATINNISIHHICSDLLNKKTLISELAKISPTHILHLAAKSFVGDLDISSIYETNVVGTTNLLEAALQIKGLKKVLLTSSANVYGKNSSGYTSEIVDPFPANHYALSKLAMEHVGGFYKDKIPIVISRPFNFTGPNQSVKFLIPKLVKAFCMHEKSISLGNVDVKREYNDVDFFSSVSMQILRVADPGCILNICTGKVFALEDVIKILEDYFGYQLIIETDPNLVRLNEIPIIGGDPTALKAAIETADYQLPNIEFEQTLKKMVKFLSVQ